MGAHPRGLEVEPLLLEVVFPLPATAVEILVKWRRLQSPGALRRVARKAFRGKVGHDEARGIALRGDFRFADDPARAAPTRERRVGQFGKTARAPDATEDLFLACPVQRRPEQRGESGFFCQPEAGISNQSFFSRINKGNPSKTTPAAKSPPSGVVITATSPETFHPESSLSAPQLSLEVIPTKINATKEARITPNNCPRQLPVFRCLLILLLP